MKKVGVAAIRKKKEDANQFSNIGKALEETKISSVKESLEMFKDSLTTFARKYRHQINSDPQFRLQFHKMCTAVGVDPLASSKGFWADLLGLGDYYYELSVVLVQTCMLLRERTGGISSLDEIRNTIQHSTNIGKNNVISVDDIARAVTTLSQLGNGFKMISIKGSPYIVSVPMELNKDHEEIFQLAGIEGHVGRDQALNLLGWQAHRFDIVISTLLRESIAWVDIYEGNLWIKFISFCFL